MFKRNKGKILKGYVSEIDQFLQELNEMPGVKSDSRIAEEQKYQRIFSLRDVPQSNLTNESLDKF